MSDHELSPGPFRGLLHGKRLVVTGVARTDSIAFAVARRALEEGAEIVLTAPPRDMAGAEEAAAALPSAVGAVLAVDATDPDDMGRLTDELRSSWGQVDGALHAIAFSPRDALHGIAGASAASVELAMRTSVYTYSTLAEVLSALAPPQGASLVGLDFDAAGAWPVYNWMGVCKAALESLNRYLARDLGPSRIRANLVAAGPLHTRAATAIPGFDELLAAWERQAPLPWDAHDPAPTADTVCFLLSDLARAVTGEIIRVDGGYHAMAAPLQQP
jgi:meromycolic acid enoyl-[acyl-carrier-protein] reductase